MTIVEIRSAVRRRAEDVVHEAVARLAAHDLVAGTTRGRRGDPFHFRFPNSGNREWDLNGTRQTGQILALLRAASERSLARDGCSS